MFENLDLDQILVKLINIKSVTGEENNIANSIKSFLLKIGFDLELVSGDSFVFNSNLDLKNSILLLGHLDTVLAQNEEQYTANVKKNIIYGRGACDMKAGLASMIKLAIDIKEKRIKPKNNVKFLFYSGEEGSLPNGLNKLMDKGLKKEDLSIVLEPSDNKVAIACLGTITIKTSISGKAAHSSTPWEGENAIYDSIDFINKVKNIPYIEKEFFGIKAISSISITQAKTYNSHNVIPDKFEFVLNFRFLPDMAKNEVLSFINKNITNDYEIIDFSPSCISDVCIPNELNKYEKIIFQGWCDMAQLVNYGIPTLVFGPGNGIYAHKVDEQISIDELKIFYEKLIKIV